MQVCFTSKANLRPSDGVGEETERHREEYERSQSRRPFPLAFSPPPPVVAYGRAAPVSYTEVWIWSERPRLRGEDSAQSGMSPEELRDVCVHASLLGAAAAVVPAVGGGADQRDQPHRRSRRVRRVEALERKSCRF